jgi:anti-sigma factor RsiW
MNCPLENNNSEILLDYCSRRLSLEATLLVEAHVEHCPECKGMTASQKAVWDALDQWEAEPVSADFDRRLYARIEQRGDGLWARLAGFAAGIHFRPAFTLGAACATVVFALLLQGPQMPRPDQSDPSIRLEAADLEQAERALEDMDMLKNLGVVAMSGDPKPDGKSL